MEAHRAYTPPSPLDPRPPPPSRSPAGRDYRRLVQVTGYVLAASRLRTVLHIRAEKGGLWHIVAAPIPLRGGAQPALGRDGYLLASGAFRTRSLSYYDATV